jgi:heme-degrading monooxygenase HmoA
MFVILWEFEVKRGYEAEFEKEYGPGGAWAQLFAKDAAYRGTRLARDTSDARRYYTLDLWASRAAYEAFRERHAEEYKSIDAQCEALTVKETRLGMLEG